MCAYTCNIYYYLVAIPGLFGKIFKKRGKNTIDADDAAPGSPGGKRVPEAVGWVIASGITRQDLTAFSGSSPALLWPARFDVRRNLSLKRNGVAQRGGRLSN